MTRFFWRAVCWMLGHSTERVPAVFFRSWDGVHEVGTLHCGRCGAMLGEYRKNLAERIDLTS